MQAPRGQIWATRRHSPLGLIGFRPNADYSTGGEADQPTLFLPGAVTYFSSMIVTIDGPAGSGKSTAARRLAERLGFDFLDTGAMYRAVALALGRRGVDVANDAAVATELPTIHIEMPPRRVLLNGEDVTEAIRAPGASQGASRVAVIPAVRIHLAGEQRRIATARRFVCEGRDQGTFVFPDAECKFFLTADPRARAERRHREMLDKGECISLEAILNSQAERDLRDASRELAPMHAAADAVIVDTTHLSADEVLEKLIEEVGRRCPTARA
ncbi:MAG TPA: (d)CMP kinase [Urbifossiella sp.]|jgi:cytidylate kinase